ncbi:hypothetical protein CSC71_14540 [Pseudoxanthomonas sangjuensis]|nr:hypothetical protein CSC71_14540 [Pseudoxanthomonas sangjuensis]
MWAAVDAAIKALLREHTTPALRSSKGLGPQFQASVLALLPELGQLTRREIARLVGVAPLNRDSGQRQGKRRIYGGRAEVRVALYMATLSAVRWEPVMRAHYQQLRARGKAGFYPEITDGCKRAENFWSCLATLRRILGLWNRSMYSNTSALAASSVG